MRLERKYVIRDWSLDQVKALVLNHPEGFFQAHPPRLVNNIYFDTPDRSSFFGNASGANLRNKYRLRWYGETWNWLENPVWELKTKDALIGKKHQEKLPDMFHQELLPLLAQWPLFQRLHLSPVLCNRYYRQYWLSFDQRFRLTLDAELFFGSYTQMFEAPALSLPSVVIAELKYKPDNEQFIDRVAQHWPFRLSRFSKFATGLAIINEKEVAI